MPVPMMDVREMRMRMRQFLVPMGMGVRLARWVARRVRMFVMLVVRMKMVVFCRLVPVLVSFRQVQPNARAHQHGRDNKAQSDALAQQQY
jgi:hypothetical protein